MVTPHDTMDHPLCTFDIPGIGICGKPKTHIVHALAGISPVEHPFRGPVTEKTKYMKLSRRNVKRLAKLTGKTVDELDMMRRVAQRQGRVLTLRYEEDARL